MTLNQELAKRIDYFKHMMADTGLLEIVDSFCKSITTVM